MVAAASHPVRRRLGAEERREQIIRATAEVIARDGYGVATLTDIARTAGVAKGLVWHYFTDRDDLMRQALAHLAETLRAALVSDIETAGPVPEVIRAVFARAARFTRTHAVELAAIDQIVHNMRTADGRQAVSSSDYDDIYADHRRLLARGQADGTVRKGDLQVMVVAYQGAIDAMIAYLQADPRLDPLDYATQAADLFLHGAAAAADADE